MQVGRRTQAADRAEGPRPRVHTLLRLAAAGVLVIGAVVTVDAVGNIADTIDRLNSDLFVKDSRAFAASYRCLERRMADLQRPTPSAHLDGAAVANQLSVFVLALAAIGTVELRGPAPGRPTIVAREDPTAPCGLELTERTG